VVGPLQIVSHRSVTYGSGHWTRSQALAENLKLKGVSAEVVELLLVLKSNEYPESTAEIRVLDIPFGLQPLAAGRLRNEKSIALDWANEIGKPRINVAAFESPIRSYPSHDRTIHGIEYLIVPAPNETGGLPEGEEIVIEAEEVPVILGTYPNQSAIESAIRTADALDFAAIIFGECEITAPLMRGPRTSFRGFVPNIFSKLRNETVMITNGGVALTEALARGVFTIAIPATVDEYFFSNELTKLFGGVVVLDATDAPSVKAQMREFERDGGPSLPKDGVANVAEIVAETIR